MRWGGYYGIEAEYVAADNCKIVSFDAEDIKVSCLPCLLSSKYLAAVAWWREVSAGSAGGVLETNWHEYHTLASLGQRQGSYVRDR